MMAQRRGKCESVIVYGDRVITKKRKLSCIDSKFKFIHRIHLVFTCVLDLTTIKTARSFKVLKKNQQYQKQFSSHPDSQCLWF